MPFRTAAPLVPLAPVAPVGPVAPSFPFVPLRPAAPVGPVGPAMPVAPFRTRCTGRTRRTRSTVCPGRTGRAGGTRRALRADERRARDRPGATRLRPVDHVRVRVDVEVAVGAETVRGRSGAVQNRRSVGAVRAVGAGGIGSDQSDRSNPPCHSRRWHPVRPSLRRDPASPSRRPRPWLPADRLRRRRRWSPCAPVAPAAPVAPCGPVVPAAPVAPVGPCAPVAPVGPVGPVATEVAIVRVPDPGVIVTLLPPSASSCPSASSGSTQRSAGRSSRSCRGSRPAPALPSATEIDPSSSAERSRRPRRLPRQEVQRRDPRNRATLVPQHEEPGRRQICHRGAQRNRLCAGRDAAHSRERVARTVADGRKPPPGSAAGRPRVSTRRHGFTGTNETGVAPTPAPSSGGLAAFAGGGVQYCGTGQFARPEASVSSGWDAKAEPAKRTGSRSAMRRLFFRRTFPPCIV